MSDHPAKYSHSLMPEFQRIVNRKREEIGYPPRVLDPFAGTGRIHELMDCMTLGVEIESEWAAMHSATMLGDATDLAGEWESTFDLVITSPTYGNRMADHHEAKDSSKRITYRHRLGHALHPNNSGQMQWGTKYRTLHKRAWAEAERVLKPDGWLVLNIRNHIRSGKEVDVTGWHIGALEDLGFRIVKHLRVDTPGMGFGANAKARVDGESVITFSREK